VTLVAAVILLLSLFPWLAIGSAVSLEDELIEAVTRGDLVAIKTVLDKGANVNAKDVEGSTALMVAANEGQVQIVRLLLKKGADVNATSPYVAGGGWTAVKAAACAGNSEVVRLLINKGSDVNAKDDEGMTALIHAAKGEAGDLGIVKMLLEKGAEVNTKDQYGRTALMHAAAAGNLEAIKLLISRGATSMRRMKTARRL
jgi:ankyrin repeat protein